MPHLRNFVTPPMACSPCLHSVAQDSNIARPTARPSHWMISLLCVPKKKIASCPFIGVGGARLMRAPCGGRGIKATHLLEPGKRFVSNGCGTRENTRPRGTPGRIHLLREL